MSLAAVLWVNNLRLDVVKGSARAVLSLLADRANHDGTAAWPSAKELAAILGVTVRTIRRHLVELEELGLIRRGNQRFVEYLPGNRRPIVWDVVLSPAVPVDNSAARGDTDVTSGLSGVTDSPTRGDRNASPGVTSGVLENRPRTTQEPKRERGARGHVRPVDNPPPAATAIPDAWAPTDRHARQAQRRGVDVVDVAEAFVAHAKANGRRLVDWDAGFDLWLTRARPLVPPPPPAYVGAGSPTRSTTADRVAQALEAGERVAQRMERERHLVAIGGEHGGA